jgi:hypothetical protein
MVITPLPYTILLDEIALPVYTILLDEIALPVYTILLDEIALPVRIFVVICDMILLFF